MSSSSSSQAVAAAGGVATDRQTAAKEKEKGGREGNEWRLDLTDKIAGPFLFLMGGIHVQSSGMGAVQTTYRGRIKLISLWEQ